MSEVRHRTVETNGIRPNLRKTVMLPGCGHWTQQERPKDVNDALIRFLKSL